MSGYTFNLPGMPIPPRPARYAEPLPEDPGTVRCLLCPRQCRIAPGKSGFCKIRTNRNGTLTVPFYGRCTSLAIDPIEKKPLYHFYPSTPILSIGTAGCNLSCTFCQNWQISQIDTVPESLSIMEPEQLAAAAVSRKIPAVAFTYNEPGIWAEYVIDAARACHARGIRTAAVTNGMIHGKGREDFYAEMDAVNIDLKGFTDTFYRRLCGGDLETVKETIHYAVHQTSAWVEVTNLIIPTYNDSQDDLERMADWFAEAAGENVPLHFSAFFPTYKLTNVPRTSPELLYSAMETAKKCGVRYVYAGNIGGTRGHSTICPHCGEEVITRYGYQTVSRIAKSNSKGVCPKCRTEIPGRFFNELNCQRTS